MVKKNETTFDASEARELLTDLETALLFEDRPIAVDNILLERAINFIHELFENEGWIEWYGGKCPLPSDRTEYQARYRDGLVGNWTDTRRAGTSLWEWVHNKIGPADIVAYRLRPQS